MSGRARDGAPRCTYAPEVGGRKAHPVFRKRLGCIFRSRPQPEMHPVLGAGSGTQFPPKTAKGKHIPFRRRIPGRAFPSGLKAENTSHSEAKFRDAISAEPSIKEKDPFAEVLVNSRWRGRESRPRAARTDRCGAYAPCELRWQTLTRLLSSTPSRGSIPCGGCIKEKDPFAEVLVNSRWRGRESNP